MFNSSYIDQWRSELEKEYGENVLPDIYIPGEDDVVKDLSLTRIVIRRNSQEDTVTLCIVGTTGDGSPSEEIRDIPIQVIIERFVPELREKNEINLDLDHKVLSIHYMSRGDYGIFIKESTSIKCNVCEQTHLASTRITEPRHPDVPHSTIGLRISTVTLDHLRDNHIDVCATCLVESCQTTKITLIAKSKKVNHLDSDKSSRLKKKDKKEHITTGLNLEQHKEHQP